MSTFFLESAPLNEVIEYLDTAAPPSVYALSEAIINLCRCVQQLEKTVHEIKFGRTEDDE